MISALGKVLMMNWEPKPSQAYVTASQLAECLLGVILERKKNIERMIVSNVCGS